MPNIITRRSFLSTAGRAAVGLGVASLMTIPPFLKRALAEGNIGINGKKLIFIFLRGGNDGVNNIIPILDPSYLGNRAIIGIPKHPTGDSYYTGTGGPGTCPGVDPLAPGVAIPLNNGFAALNPALADMVPIYNAGDLALIHRVGYRSLSRSHFDSEQYWEKGADGSNYKSLADGIWYRTIVESGYNKNPLALTGKPPSLTGVSLQSNMPASLRGEQPMTNLSSMSRYNLLGVYSASGSTNLDRVKVLNALDAANLQPFPAKDNRDLVHTLGVQFRDTLDIFQDPSFISNNFFDLNGTTKLFPTTSTEDPAGRFAGSFSFIQNMKSCAQILNTTDAIITGSEIGGWDLHTGQVTPGTPSAGSHANLLKRVAGTYYSLWRYFSIYGKNGTNPTPGAQVGWNDVVIVAMSEFGRTSAENASMGSDHGEASVMYVAGGNVNGRVYGCDLLTTSGTVGPNWVMGSGKTGTLFSANTSEGYVKRTIDYRSVLGEIIRDHLGATPNQLNRIIPAYANEAVEHLFSGGTVSSTPILGELGII